MYLMYVSSEILLIMRTEFDSMNGIEFDLSCTFAVSSTVFGCCSYYCNCESLALDSINNNDASILSDAHSFCEKCAHIQTN